jgi:ribosome maturation factor RimP
LGGNVDYRPRLNELVEGTAIEIGLDLIEYDLFQAGQRKILRIFIDKDGGINVEDCRKMSKQLSVALDLEDILPFAFLLEVSSPGVDRPLQKKRDFERQRGRTIKINYRENGSEIVQKLLAKLIDADDEGALVEIDGVENKLMYEQILSAKVEIQF